MKNKTAAFKGILIFFLCMFSLSGCARNEKVNTGKGPKGGRYVDVGSQKKESQKIRKKIVAVVPLGDVDARIIHVISDTLERKLLVHVVVLPQHDLPEYAFYKPRSRYRAEKLLDYLKEINQSAYWKILGITKKDISTTKDSYEDWGIFGLGVIGGESCVVSTFRLCRRGVTKEKCYDRVRKVVVHELGHTFGLAHCPIKGCVMEDAEGTIKTVDNETGKFCDVCKKKIMEELER